ncbi:asparaginase [Anoxybacillus sp. J5B_2022]|uniref:asparaginase n=1 Tax=Anoxybacillus sp. J5B_2022 TaxID=3003246 RepID=UPI0022855CD1|nr:asparaginase [Anoxybacillus sp. J5B_2022]MCZ0756106.1 asparaginase [Anoxybacillus sp. J5B_2022]
MKNILLLATGGTIASVPSEEGLTPKLTAEQLTSYIAKENGPYQLDSQILMNIDSTNMQPEHWREIAEAIYKNYDKYDGFVVTHGTDTMAYTAAALSYMLQYVNKPIVLTGSQVPIGFEKTDAKKNIRDALRFACENIGGVFVVFDGRVILGTRAVKMRTKSYDAFESINHPYVAYIHKDRIDYQYELETTHEQLQFDPSLCPDVFLLKLHPGTKPEIFDYIRHLYRGVIIESFGSGGVPFQGRNLLPKIKELIDDGMAVVITTQCLEEGEDLTLYEVGRKVAQNTVILSGDMNTEAIVPKLMWALGKTANLLDIKKIMETPIANDITPKQEESWDA